MGQQPVIADRDPEPGRDVAEREHDDVVEVQHVTPGQRHGHGQRNHGHERDDRRRDPVGAIVAARRLELTGRRRQDNVLRGGGYRSRFGDCQLCSTRATNPEQGRVHPGGLPCGARTPEWRARERPSIITHPAVGWVGGGLPPNGGSPAWGTSTRESAHACLPPERGEPRMGYLHPRVGARLPAPRTGGAPHGVPVPRMGYLCPAWGTPTRKIIWTPRKGPARAASPSAGQARSRGDDRDRRSGAPRRRSGTAPPPPTGG